MKVRHVKRRNQKRLLLLAIANAKVEVCSAKALDEWEKLYGIDSTTVIREELRTQFARICAAAQVPEHMLHGQRPEENDK